MLVRFWGTRGSLPVATRSDATLNRIVRALVVARGRKFADAAEAAEFARTELEFATWGAYGGATSCVEIEGGEDAFVVCDMGSGLREFGLSAQRRCAEGHPRVYHFFLSHMHWDHIMGFPYFRPAYESGATIVIHSGHPDAEAALRRQQEEISFPVPFDALKARLEFVVHRPGATFEAAGLKVSLISQSHAHGSVGYRFERHGRSVVYSTDAEHSPDDMDSEAGFVSFFAQRRPGDLRHHVFPGRDGEPETGPGSLVQRGRRRPLPRRGGPTSGALSPRAQPLRRGHPADVLRDRPLREAGARRAAGTRGGLRL